MVARRCRGGQYLAAMQTYVTVFMAINVPGQTTSRKTRQVPQWDGGVEKDAEWKGKRGGPRGTAVDTVTHEQNAKIYMRPCTCALRKYIVIQKKHINIIRFLWRSTSKFFSKFLQKIPSEPHSNWRDVLYICNYFWKYWIGVLWKTLWFLERMYCVFKSNDIDFFNLSFYVGFIYFYQSSGCF